MQLLTNLLSKDIYDMSHLESGVTPDQAPTPVDVFLYGLNIVMPLMTINLLKFPSLCRQLVLVIHSNCTIVKSDYTSQSYAIENVFQVLQNDHSRV